MTSLSSGGLPEKYVAPWLQTKWLVMSSGFFLLPAWYAYLLRLNSFSLLLVATSLISANYWRKATYSWRRQVDLLFAKYSFAVFVGNGIIYVRKVEFAVPAYSGLVLILYCFYQSSQKWTLRDNTWFQFHFCFHLLMACEQWIILRSMSEDSKNT
jgi:hypothetical protein